MELPEKSSPFWRPINFFPLLLAIACFYNGAAQSQHILALFALVGTFWLAAILASSSNPDRAVNLHGLLPAILLLYLIWLLVLPRFSGFPHASWLQSTVLAALPVAFFGWLLIPQGISAKLWGRTWTGITIVALALSVWGLIDFFALRVRAHGPLIDANAFGALLNLVLIPHIVRFLTNSDQTNSARNVKTLGVIGVIALAQFSTESRGALLALAICLLLALAFTRSATHFKTRLARLVAVLVLTYAIIGALAIRVPLPSAELLAAAPAEYLKKDPSADIRIHLWQSTWAIFRNSDPLTGTGLDTFKIFYPHYRHIEDNATEGNYAHNDYLQALQEGGVPLAAFFLVIFLISPAWLLLRLARQPTNSSNGAILNADAIGLVLGVVAIALHALVNFIHFILPISLLSGLYLAKAWISTRSDPANKTVPKLISELTTHRITRIVIVGALIFVTALLMIDGAIFKLYLSENRVSNQISPELRYSLLNAFVVLRGNNPIPREVLVRQLIAAAEKTPGPETKEMLLAQASKDIQRLDEIAPALPIALYLSGKVHLARGGKGELAVALDTFEAALRRAPQSILIRLELAKLYRTLGDERRAYAIAADVKRWLASTRDYVSLEELVNIAASLATRYGDANSIVYWAKLRSILQTRKDET